jgi:hypothetical protein
LVLVGLKGAAPAVDLTPVFSEGVEVDEKNALPAVSEMQEVEQEEMQEGTQETEESEGRVSPSLEAEEPVHQRESGQIGKRKQIDNRGEKEERGQRAYTSSQSPLCKPFQSSLGDSPLSSNSSNVVPASPLAHQNITKNTREVTPRADFGSPSDPSLSPGGTPLKRKRARKSGGGGGFGSQFSKSLSPAHHADHGEDVCDEEYAYGGSTSQLSSPPTSPTPRTIASQYQVSQVEVSL